MSWKVFGIIISIIIISLVSLVLVVRHQNKVKREQFNEEFDKEFEKMFDDDIEF
jgi:hypothetical protein